MRQRVVTAIIALAVLAAVVFKAPPALTELVIAVVLLAGAWEWSGFLATPIRVLRYTYVAFIAILLLLVFQAGPGTADTLLLLALAWWLGALGWTFFFPTRIALPVRWLAGAAVLVPAFLALVMLFRAGPLTLLFVLVIVWVADSGAFAAGKLLGRVKLAPSISPGKTWEGVIGGLAAVTLLVLLFSQWVETDLAVFLPFCLAVAGLSIVGDLTVSMFKRTVGLKDSGTLFPGHGGVLDRIDSIAAAAPLYVLGMRWLGL